MMIDFGMCSSLLSHGDQGHEGHEGTSHESGGVGDSHAVRLAAARGPALNRACENKPPSRFHMRLVFAGTIQRAVGPLSGPTSRTAFATFVIFVAPDPSWPRIPSLISQISL
jgi:hypothetical protein